MGVWGTGSFENDDALDWLGELPNHADWSCVQPILIEFPEGATSVATCYQLVAAAELVAAARGHERKGLPSEADNVLSSNDETPPDELANSIAENLERVLKKSALKSLWQESDKDYKIWRQNLRAIQIALKKPSLPRKVRKAEESLESLTKRLTTLLKQEEWNQSVNVCDKILLLAPQRATTHNNRAWSLAHLDRLDEAMESIEIAIGLLNEGTSPTTLVAACHGTRGYIFLRMREFRQAIDDISKALSLVERAINYENRAEAYEALGEIELATNDRLTARNLRLKEHLKIAKSHWNNENYKQSVAELDKLLIIDPTHQLGLYRRAMTSAELRCWSASQDDLSKLIETQPDNAFFYFDRMNSRAQLDEAGLAREDREMCRKLGFDVIAFYDHHVNMCGSKVTSSNPSALKGAVKDLAFVLKLVPEHAEARRLKEKAHRNLGETKKADAELKALKMLIPLPDTSEGNLEKEWAKFFWDMMTKEE